VLRPLLSFTWLHFIAEEWAQVEYLDAAVAQLAQLRAGGSKVACCFFFDEHGQQGLAEGVFIKLLQKLQKG
jgi:hypothetical protein